MGQTYTRRTITKAVAEGLVAKYGNTTNAVKAILPNCRNAMGSIPTHNAVFLWLSMALNDRAPADTPAILDNANAEKLNQIRHALEGAGVPIDAIGEIKNARVRSGFHEGLTKDPDGNPVVTKLESKHVSITLTPAWEDGPAWPLIQPGKPVTIKNPVTTKKKSTDNKTIVVISDVQVGFLRDIEDPSRLTPMHDLPAIEVALQIVADLQPDQIGYVGDFLDLPEMSRYLQNEEFWRTTQPSIDEGYKILAQFEAAAGPDRDRTIFIAGNHERRLQESVLKYHRAAFHLRPAAQTPATWPDLTVPHLLRFEELGIEYMGEYPGGEWYITPELVVRHNPESRTAYAASVIAGHSHHVKRETYSLRTPQGPMHQTLWEIGCLASLDNYASRGSLVATRVPSNRGFVKDWAHSFAVVTVTPELDHAVELVEYIGRGQAIFRGKRYVASNGD